MSYDKEETEILLFLNDLLGDFVLQYESLDQKKIYCQETIQELIMQVSDLKDKVDANYDYFSPGGKTVNLLREKMETELKMEQLKLENYNNQFIVLLKRIDQINLITNYIVKMAPTQEKRNKCIDDYGLQILETQENERTRIAGDLHDSTVQNLTNLVHKTELCLKLIDIDTVRTKLELQTMIDTIRNTINDMRVIIYNLRPMSINDLGLVVTIERYINQLMRTNDTIYIDFIVENDEIDVKPVINITLFRIVQEACNNVLEHANANKVKIRLVYSESTIQLIFEDNGIGFSESIYSDSCNEKQIRFGLSIMKERAYLLSGKINIESEENNGTKISVIVPL